jgi:hypothetical protein
MNDIQNPKHQFPEYMQRALDGMRASRMDALPRRHQVAIDSRPTAEERNQLKALLGESSRVDESVAKRLVTSFRNRVGLIEWKDFAPPLSPVDNAPEARAADFWWARTQLFGGAGGIAPQFQTDGVHFFGRLGYDSDPLFGISVGAFATFELQPERRPLRHPAASTPPRM